MIRDRYDHEHAEEYGLIADAFAESPPAQLRERTLRTARFRRPAATAPPPAISPVEALSRTIDDVGRLLAELTDVDWDLPAIDDLTVKGLVGHVVGADRYLGAKLGAWDGDYGTVEHDHRATTRNAIDEAMDSTPGDVTSTWSHTSSALVQHLNELHPDELLAPARYNVVQTDLGGVLVARTFELWTHVEDICRATSRPLVPPDTERLTVMTNVAAALVPLGVEMVSGGTNATVRLVLTGEGGGTWDRALGEGGPGEPDATIVADAVDFCRLMARRIAPNDLDCELLGDRDLGELVLVGATQFAMD
jgi:uncharacterized protein (TIGR03083 family)